MASEIIWEPKGVIQRFSGHCNNDDLGASLSGIFGHGRFDDIKYVIYDFLDIGCCRCDLNTVENTAAISSAASATNPNVKVAIVATQPWVVEWAPTFIDISGTRYPTRLFSTLEEARAWAVVPGANVSQASLQT